MAADKDKSIEELAQIASAILKKKQNSEQQRRPLLIEFCGSPKSGKTTTIASLAIFLRRNNFKTVIITERASLCPIGNKKHPFFNLWTLTASMAKILEHLDEGTSKYDIIIADRGMFDALCWFEWLNNVKAPDNFANLDDATYESYKSFIVNDQWRRFIDIIYVFRVDPKISIEREYANLLTNQRGSIMSERVLETFNDSITSVMKNHKKNFRNIIEIETDKNGLNDSPSLVSYNVTMNILDSMSELLNERIGYFDAALRDTLGFGINNFSKIEKSQILFDNKTKVEASKSIQPIPIAVITNYTHDKVLVVKKNKKYQPTPSAEDGKILIYLGGHMRQEDKFADEDNKQVFAKTLYRELHEEIGESLMVKDIEPFLIYTPENYRSEKHLAICYVMEMDLEEKKFKLNSNEFIAKSGNSLSGQVISIDKIVQEYLDLDSWGYYILKNVFNRSMRPPELFNPVP